MKKLMYVFLVVTFLCGCASTPITKNTNQTKEFVPPTGFRMVSPEYPNLYITHDDFEDIDIIVHRNFFTYADRAGYARVGESFSNDIGGRKWNGATRINFMILKKQDNIFLFCDLEVFSKDFTGLMKFILMNDAGKRIQIDIDTVKRNLLNNGRHTLEEARFNVTYDMALEFSEMFLEKQLKMRASGINQNIDKNIFASDIKSYNEVISYFISLHDNNKVL